MMLTENPECNNSGLDHSNVVGTENGIEYSEDEGREQRQITRCLVD